MNLMRPLLAIAALVALYASPASAAGHCPHAREDAGPMPHAETMDHAQHHHDAAAVAEAVPAGGAEGETACKHRAGEACQCKSQMALACGMTSCCIKSDGPLSTGLNDRLPTNDDHALQVRSAPYGVDGETAVAAYRRGLVPRVMPGPDPRPPSA